MTEKFMKKAMGMVLILMFSCTVLFAQERTSAGVPVQERTVTGKVIDDKDKEPLPGLTVSVKGRPSNVATDVNGNFSIRLQPTDSVLVFSYIGYVRQQVNVSRQSTITVSMTADAKSLDEVVVVGYSTQKKATLTGSVVSISAAEIEDLPVSNLGAALSGRLLGVGVSGGTARPGSVSRLTIRNPNTFLSKDGGTTEPLFVIDDVVQVTSQGAPDNTLFNNLDASEVESISILKDAEAAIYGSRAANGVVLVTTKRGKDGKPRVSYSGSYAINDETYRPKMMNAYQFGMYYNIMNGPNGAKANPGVDNFFTQDELDYMKTVDYNWLDMAWKPSMNMRHTLAVSGGANKSTYFADASYYTQDGNLGDLKFNRWNYRAGTDVHVANNLKVGLQVSGNIGAEVRTFNKIGGEALENDYINLLTSPRHIPPYVNGLAVKLPGTDAFAGYNFFEVQRLGNTQSNDNRYFSINLNAEYAVPFVKGLKVKGLYSTNMTNNAGAQVGSKYTLNEFNRLGTNKHIYDGATYLSSALFDNGNRLYYSNTNSKLTQTNLFLNYSRDFGSHSISGLVSVEKSEGDSKGQVVFKSDPLLTTNGQFGTAFGTVDGSTTGSESGSLGYIGRLNYSYANKYLAQFLFRSDASTKFAPENYWGKFYSGSVGWVVSEESFFKVPAIDFLKIRYSMGLVGNDQTKAWLWRQRYTYQDGKGGVFGGNGAATTGMKMEASPNPNGTWSDEFKNDLGIDSRFLNNRLSLTLDGYYNHASNILIERTGNIPVTVGGTIASENYGIANYFGTEIGLGWNAKAGKDFSYGLDLRFSWSDNKVIRMAFNDNDIMYPWNAKPGESSDNGKWGYDNLGMFRTQEDIDSYVSQYGIKSMFGTNAVDFRPGMLFYRDVRGPLQADGSFAAPDGIVDSNDQIQLSKKANNHYGYGFTLRAGYKGFSFDAVISGSFGGWSEIDNRSKLNNSIARAFKSTTVYWADIYDPQLNPTGTMPNPNFEDVSLKPSSNFYKVDAFRMALRNFNLNYTLPKKLVQRAGISNARISLTGINPVILFNPYNYRDPDQSYLAYPNLKTYSLGLNVTL